jgi:hypothetical protein
VSKVNEHTCIRRVAERVKTDRQCSTKPIRKISGFLHRRAFTSFLSIFGGISYKLLLSSVTRVYVCECVLRLLVCILRFTALQLISLEARMTLEKHNHKQLQVSLPFVVACSAVQITAAKSEE